MLTKRILTTIEEKAERKNENEEEISEKE